MTPAWTPVSVLCRAWQGAQTIAYLQGLWSMRRPFRKVEAPCWDKCVSVRSQASPGRWATWSNLPLSPLGLAIPKVQVPAGGPGWAASPTRSRPQSKTKITHNRQPVLVKRGEGCAFIAKVQNQVQLPPPLPDRCWADHILPWSEDEAKKLRHLVGTSWKIKGIWRSAPSWIVTHLLTQHRNHRRKNPKTPTQQTWPAVQMAWGQNPSPARPSMMKRVKSQWPPLLRTQSPMAVEWMTGHLHSWRGRLAKRASNWVICLLNILSNIICWWLTCWRNCSWK